MHFGVITDVEPPETGMNMATPLGELYLSTDGLDCRRVTGIEQMAFRIPVFTVGEILVLDGGGREVSGRGRNPSKWGVTCELFDSIDDAVDRARGVSLTQLDRLADAQREAWTEPTRDDDRGENR